ncbi:hypothetical protein [uncultured phage cr61_1]|uniref:Uncharacterized protein n=1 Tax=uncultured phage cr61_1 TaxID=2986417 RepID=A0AAE7RWA3_9CAUD|nr:hypothetical protein OJM08_gp71 [uncultured phage cr61_1]QWM90571.1 hypothetical protein [uncultured phage cr61_1]
MGKISKYSNLYRNNTLERHVDDKGVLRKYTLKEVQDLVDKLGTEKDENGHIKDQEGFNNASYILMQMYNDSKYNDEKENFIKDLNDRLRVNKEEVTRSLNEMDKGIQQDGTTKTSVVTESEGVRVSEESRADKERRDGDSNIKFNLYGQEVTMSKEDVENEKEFSKGAFLKSYDVNDSKDEYVECEEVKDDKES